MPQPAESTPTPDTFSKDGHGGGFKTCSCGGCSCSTPSATILSSPLLPGLPLTSNLAAAFTRQECTGFPTGNFRIRAAGTQRYWTLHRQETNGDGNAVSLWDNIDNSRAQVFFITPRGELCCSGLHIDAMGSTLIVAHNRLPTHPWPNPWSHPLPTFSYSEETKMISVKFYSDPLISYKWPRSEEEWNNKEFVLATQPSAKVKIYHFNDIARWAPSARFIRWTDRTNDTWDKGSSTGLAVEEKAVSDDAVEERMQWELEPI